MSLEGLPAIGDTVVGKYRITRQLGRGGMGAVYEAIHLRLDQKVAIKVVLPGVAMQPELVYRFEHEARAAARLRGRHTARVYDVDTSPEGLRFLVMELLDGHSLRDELIQRGPLPVTDAVRYVREACEGIDEAHRAGIVHRDVKPANLFLSNENGGVVVKVVDFGIAKASGPADENYHTATNVPLGTYKFMSPEQARAPRSVDARTDIWSLGVVLYQLLAGKTPFDGDGAFGVLYAIMSEQPQSVRALRPDVPESLAAVIERALCKDVAGRHQTARELSNELAPFEAAGASPLLSSSLSSSAAAVGPSPYIQAPPPPTSAQHLAPPAPWAPQEPGLTQAPVPPGYAPFGRTSAPSFEPPRPTPPLFAQALGAGEPNESITSAAKSHVVPIKPATPTTGSFPLSVWLIGGVVVLATGGGLMAGMKVSRLRSQTTMLLASGAPSETAPSLEAVVSMTTAPPSASAQGTLPSIPFDGGAAGAVPAAPTLTAGSDAVGSARTAPPPAGRSPAAKVRPGKPHQQDKPAGEPPPAATPSTPPKPPAPAEQAVPEVL